MTFQDVKYRLCAAGETMRPFVINMKIMANARQSHIMDTSFAPGVDPNFDYWDAHFLWTW